MTVKNSIEAIARQLARQLMLALCLAGMLFAQAATAADQAVDVAALGAFDGTGDPCEASASASASDADDHKGRSQTSTHCQSCCFHHNGQSTSSLTGYDHDGGQPDATFAPRGDRALTSAALATEKDPPRRLA